MVPTKRVLLTALFATAFAAPARAADFFVVTDTLTSQQDAQARAARVGGWVLDTDAYTALAPGRFAVVRGPYSNRKSAEKELKELKATKSYQTAYVKDAGAFRVAPAFAKAVPPKVLAALLGELSVVVTDRQGGSNPCEPQEPYQDVTVSVMLLDRTVSPDSEVEGFKPRRHELDIGGFWVIKRTGAVERMRLCAE